MCLSLNVVQAVFSSNSFMKNSGSSLTTDRAGGYPRKGGVGSDGRFGKRVRLKLIAVFPSRIVLYLSNFCQGRVFVVVDGHRVGIVEADTFTLPKSGVGIL